MANNGVRARASFDKYMKLSKDAKKKCDAREEVERAAFAAKDHAIRVELSRTGRTVWMATPQLTQRWAQEMIESMKWQAYVEESLPNSASVRIVRRSVAPMWRTAYVWYPNPEAYERKLRARAAKHYRRS